MLLTVKSLLTVVHARSILAVAGVAQPRHASRLKMQHSVVPITTMATRAAPCALARTAVANALLSRVVHGTLVPHLASQPTMQELRVRAILFPLGSTPWVTLSATRVQAVLGGKMVHSHTGALVMARAVGPTRHAPVTRAGVVLPATCHVLKPMVKSVVVMVSVMQQANVFVTVAMWVLAVKLSAVLPSVPSPMTMRVTA